MDTNCGILFLGRVFPPAFFVVGSPRDMFEPTRTKQRRQHKCQQHGPRINRKSPLFHWSQCLSLFAHSVSPSLANRSNKRNAKQNSLIFLLSVRTQFTRFAGLKHSRLYSDSPLNTRRSSAPTHQP